MSSPEEGAGAAPDLGGAAPDPSLNDLGQPIGWPVEGIFPLPLPPRGPMEGLWCRLDPTRATDAEALQAAFDEDREGEGWTYLLDGPFPDANALRAWIETSALGPDPQFFTIRLQGRAVGLASYLRIAAQMGTIEIGHLHFAPALQRTAAATEAMALMMGRAFDLGYRRVEWKCDALNAPSRRAAERLGLTYEGTFRQAMHYRGRNRDTAWFSILDREWPARKARFAQWLGPSNFDGGGRQKSSL